MSQAILASGNASSAPSARWAHDIRNTLATVGLYLETLERLSGSRGREIAHAAHLLMSRTAAMCSEVMTQGVQSDLSNRRAPFDVAEPIFQVANLLRPIAPEGFEISVAASGTFVVLAHQQEVFRVMFNLVHNAIAVARQQTGGRRMTGVTLLLERRDAVVTVRIADDGPGLPKSVRANLFRRQQSTTGGSGMGLLIARELAERNGGTLHHAESARGTTFVLELPGSTRAATKVGALRSLGKRVVAERARGRAV